MASISGGAKASYSKSKSSSSFSGNTKITISYKGANNNILSKDMSVNSL